VGDDVHPAGRRGVAARPGQGHGLGACSRGGRVWLSGAAWRLGRERPGRRFSSPAVLPPGAVAGLPAPGFLGAPAGFPSPEDVRGDRGGPGGGERPLRAAGPAPPQDLLGVGAGCRPPRGPAAGSVTPVGRPRPPAWPLRVRRAGPLGRPCPPGVGPRARRRRLTWSSAPGPPAWAPCPKPGCRGGSSTAHDESLQQEQAPTWKRLESSPPKTRPPPSGGSRV